MKTEERAGAHVAAALEVLGPHEGPRPPLSPRDRARALLHGALVALNGGPWPVSLWPGERPGEAP